MMGGEAKTGAGERGGSAQRTRLMLLARPIWMYSHENSIPRAPIHSGIKYETMASAAAQPTNCMVLVSEEEGGVEG